MVGSKNHFFKMKVLLSSGRVSAPTRPSSFDVLDMYWNDIGAKGRKEGVSK